MSIKLNGNEFINNILYNGTNLTKVIYNGTTVWETPVTIFFREGENIWYNYFPKGKALTQSPRSSLPSGYSFVGWSTSSTGDNPQTTFTPTEDMFMYRVGGYSDYDVPLSSLSKRSFSGSRSFGYDPGGTYFGESGTCLPEIIDGAKYERIEATAYVGTTNYRTGTTSVMRFFIMGRDEHWGNYSGNYTWVMNCSTSGMNGFGFSALCGGGGGEVSFFIRFDKVVAIGRKKVV